MEHETSGTQAAIDTATHVPAQAASRARWRLYLIVGVLLLVGIAIYLIVGSYIANLLQVLTNFNS